MANTTNPETAPTIHYTLIGRERGSSITILDGRTIQSGSRAAGIGVTSYATIRRWAADAAAHGVTDIVLIISRHTRALGWSYDTLGRSKRVRLAVTPCRFEDASKAAA